MKQSRLLCIVLIVLLISCHQKDEPVRQEFSLNSDWKTVVSDSISTFNGFETLQFSDSSWKSVNIPHNWDKYHGYLRKLHGNFHGYAWYRKSFTIEKNEAGKRYFLFFEGVGSYATVWLNGKQVGFHAGGRTTFTIDISKEIVFDKPNILAIRADHRAEIRDLPWVCGGCSDEWGFSEGSQPLGIFRPVTLYITKDIRIEPFGVHIWNDTTVNEKKAVLNINTEIKNYSERVRKINVISSLLNKNGKKVKETNIEIEVNPFSTETIKGKLKVDNPDLWSPLHSYLYSLRTKLIENGEVIDQTETDYGIRWISWPLNRHDSSNTFLINGKQVFINGIGEYEHMFGNSHAFTKEQIQARVQQIKEGGFNAFRDAHQPHNLLYQEILDKEGILWWTQMSAHIWFDNPEFRENFKILLKEWVKERRNNPSNIMWGLQNESVLPADFAEECVQIIREMDPTASSQRLVTTCNGGVGTDWNVVQNWSGTYGGDPQLYDSELSTQLLNGEYGAWRSIDLHTEGPFNQNGILSEDRMSQLLEMKIMKAESVRNKVCGQFLWLLSSHDNPGRIQNGEGFRDIDRIGPVNYKGLFTPWGEPLDAFYMYRSNYYPKEKGAMIYIVSHTWPNRWTKPGVKDSIIIYSNCDEVELFNDIENVSLGKKKKNKKGESFIWEKAEIKYNVLYAKGFVNGNEAAKDMIVLNHLPESPNFNRLKEQYGSILKPEQDYNYLYRVNCGGDDYSDENGNLWLADREQISEDKWGSLSWNRAFSYVPFNYGSQRRTFDPVFGTKDQPLFQTFRYGLEELSFNFPVKDGEYLIELYFMEPWYGTGGGMNCNGWRIFDVAVNDKVYLDDFDIWNEADHDKVLKKRIIANVNGGMLKIHFPEVKSGQAIISAISVATKEKKLKPADPSPGNILNLSASSSKIKSWLDIGDLQFTDKKIRFSEIPSLLFGNEWIKTPYEFSGPLKLNFNVRQTSDVFIAIQSERNPAQIIDNFKITPLKVETDDNIQYNLYGRRFISGEKVSITGIPKHYSVFVVPVNSLQAPTDQRILTEYSSEKAILKGTAGIKKKLPDRIVIEFINNTSEIIEWQFNVGLASTYAVHFKFQNNSEKNISTEMEIVTSTGILIKNETITLKSATGKWQTVKTDTGSQINAGSYRVMLKIKNAKGLLLQRMEIQ